MYSESSLCLMTDLEKYVSCLNDRFLKSLLPILNLQPSTLSLILNSPSSYLKSPFYDLNSLSSTLLPASSVISRGARDALRTNHQNQHKFFQGSFLSPIQNQYNINFKTSYHRDTIENLSKSCINTPSRFSSKTRD